MPRWIGVVVTKHPDWEWVMEPGSGLMSWGVWRDEAVSGDGVLGVIRFEGRDITHQRNLERSQVTQQPA